MCVIRPRACGDLAETQDVDSLTAVLDTFLFGITTQARDGVPLHVLEGAVDDVMKLWSGAE